MADPSETTRVSREPADQESEELLAAVRALTTQVGGLQAELETLRAQPRQLPIPAEERPGWDDRLPVERQNAAWVRSLDTPKLRRAAVPWLALEIVFLVAVAVLVAVAGLSAPAVVAVMVVAWLLVAVGEWLAARTDRQRHALAYGAGVQVTASAPDDLSWFASNGDDTLLDAPSSERPPTRLPPPE